MQVCFIHAYIHKYINLYTYTCLHTLTHIYSCMSTYIHKYKRQMAYDTTPHSLKVKKYTLFFLSRPFSSLIIWTVPLPFLLSLKCGSHWGTTSISHTQTASATASCVPGPVSLRMVNPLTLQYYLTNISLVYFSFISHPPSPGGGFWQDHSFALCGHSISAPLF